MAEVWPGGRVKDDEQLHPLVSQLVGYIWREAIGELESVLGIPLQSVKLEQVRIFYVKYLINITVFFQVEKAEAALLSIRRLLDEGTAADSDGINPNIC